MVTLDDKQQIEQNIPLVHSIARRFNGRGIDYDDLFQAGCVGLVKAVKNFDEGKGFAFSTYAVPVIMGEIRRLFREGGAVKVSRSLKDKSLKASRIREAFLSDNDREPTVAELSELLGCSVGETVEIINASASPVSIDCGGEDGEQTIDIPYDESEALFDRLAVQQLLQKLNEDEKQLVEFRYYRGYTQCKTAKLLGTSQVQISRKEKRILQKMRSIYNC